MRRHSASDPITSEDLVRGFVIVSIFSNSFPFLIDRRQT